MNAETLKKLGFAPKNESYVLNVLRHLELIDDDGNRTEKAAKAFNLHEDSAFQKSFGELVKAGYQDLFELHGEGSWKLDTESLISFFRTNDQTTEIVGQRQASTFRLLAAYSGHGDVPEPKGTKKTTSKTAKHKACERAHVNSSSRLFRGARQQRWSDCPNRNQPSGRGRQGNL